MPPCLPGTPEIVSDVSNYMTTKEPRNTAPHHPSHLGLSNLVGCPTEQPNLREDLHEPRMPIAGESLGQSTAVPLCAICKALVSLTVAKLLINRK
jgi:hypothetical protein